MDGKGFKIQRVRVEGFKGFTTGQAITVDGKHVFVLGPNGFGKSSLVEAIRWGLFGSTRRPGETVANQDYTGSCRVDLVLKRGDGDWTLKRTLIRGVSGGSDADILDNLGQSHGIKEVLPRLQSLPAGEGMHIVYAAQNAPLRRPADDLSPFEKTIYSYLGLADVRVTISRLNDFLETHVLRENTLAKDIDEKRSYLESELGRATDQRQRFIENRPWPGDHVPIQEETATRIGTFIKGLSLGAYSETVSPTPGIFSLIDEAESVFNRVSDISGSAIQARIAEVQKQIGAAALLSSELANREAKLATAQQEIALLKERLVAALSGTTLESLAKSVEAFDKDVEDKALLLDLQHRARIWTERHIKEPEEQYCPICRREHELRALLQSLADRVARESAERKAIVAKRDNLKTQYQETMRLVKQVEELDASCSSFLRELCDTTDKIRSFLDSDLQNEDIASALHAYLTASESDRVNLQSKLRETGELKQAWKRELENLQDEVRFHKVQQQLISLHQRMRDLEAVRDSLKTLVLFGDSVRQLRDNLERALNETLKVALPSINEKLSEAFIGLTEHPVYSRVLIAEGRLPKLELRVATDNNRLAGWEPSAVLNGQALNALELVPYFAFSELTDVPLEVYLLLLDDPTQSFDGHHIDILVGKLAELGRRVQLIVASHEIGYFQNLLSKHFDRDEYIVARVTGFLPRNGPTLEIC